MRNRRAVGWMCGAVLILSGLSCGESGLGEQPLALGYVTDKIDILFVVDNSASMVGEQLLLGKSFASFIGQIEQHFGTDYQIAVITTGIESEGCPVCEGAVTGSCMNPTLEGGRFPGPTGRNYRDRGRPVYDFITDPGCAKIIDSASKGCFYDDVSTSPNYERGIALTGINGCGYERGLEAVRLALGKSLASTNGSFLRSDAALAVVLVSDEDDCGAVGDVSENLPYTSGNACYYAAKGIDPEGKTKDAKGKDLMLTPVADYYDFLVGLKGNREGMVKFAGIVGITDEANPSATEIQYVYNDTSARWDIAPACQASGCTGKYCAVGPGTRYIELAEMFGLGQNGFLSTLCADNFSATVAKLGKLAACPAKLYLKWKPEDLTSLQIQINGVAIPKEKWTYLAPTAEAPNGVISFGEGYDVCELVQPGAFAVTVAKPGA